MDDEISRLRRRGEWTALRRGAYVRGDVPTERRARHLLAVHATVAGLRTPAVVSHQSAAVLHGLPLWGVPLRRVHITRRPPARSDEGARLRSPVARLAPDDVVADAALYARLTTEDELHAVLEANAGTRGARAARRVVDAADGRSESVGESRSRAARLLGEFDGFVTYGRLLRPGQDPGEVVFLEKQREDALRDEDWRMVRWIRRELDSPAVLGRRIEQRLAAAR